MIPFGMWGGVNEPPVVNLACIPWNRPSDFLPMPAFAPGEEKLCWLAKVSSTSDAFNYVAMICTGAYTVNWGDGVIQNFASGATASHQYIYSSPALNGTFTSEGFKQALITITPQAGSHLVTINSAVRPTGAASGLRSIVLDIVGSLPFCTTYSTTTNPGQSSRTTQVRRVLIKEGGGRCAPKATCQPDLVTGPCELIEYKTMGGCLAPINSSDFFRDCIKLTCPQLDTAGTTNFSYMFSGCLALRSADLNTTSGTNFSYMFNGCINLEYLDMYTELATNLNNMFNGCVKLETANVDYKVNGVTTGGMFYNCAALTSYGLITATYLGDCESMFYGCSSLVTFETDTELSYTKEMFRGCTSLSGDINIKVYAEDLTRMFYNCSSLENVVLNLNFNDNYVRNMFANCTSLLSVVMNSSVFYDANDGGTTGMFYNCPMLNSLKFGVTSSSSGIFYNNELRNSFDISNCNLGASALSYIYNNNLQALSPSFPETLTVTGNPGAATSKAPATAKNWIVIN